MNGINYDNIAAPKITEQDNICDNYWNYCYEDTLN